jgi:hypothetical protein
MVKFRDNVNEAVFLTSLILGDLLLVASFAITRLNWRADEPPCNLRASSLDVLRHPEKYAQPQVLRRVRALQIAGVILLIVAVAAIAR